MKFKMIVSISDGYYYREIEAIDSSEEAVLSKFLEVNASLKNGEKIRNVEVWQLVHEGLPVTKLELKEVS